AEPEPRVTMFEAYSARRLAEFGLVARAAKLMHRAYAAGLRPDAIELGFDEGMLAPAGEVILGMTVRRRARPGMAVLALPSRKIGRYEVVIPTRFEEGDKEEASG